MKNPTVLVTGASRGIGAATARQLAKLNANVVLMARSEGLLQAVARECEALGGMAWVSAGDVSQEADCARVVHEAIEQFGSLNALVNNSGIIEPLGMLRDAPAAGWEQLWAVNVLGPVLLTRQALPHLRRQKGRVINISSGAAEKVMGGWAAYSASKAALNKITQILASEEPEITAAALKPGVVETDIQVIIRETGKGRMAEENYRWLTGLYEQNQMLPPEKPGLAIACLAMAMPPEWSGQVILWEEERVQDLVSQLTASWHS